MGKKTLVIGASSNPEKYSYLAIRKLVSHENETIAIGLNKGNVAGIDIIQGFPELENIDTVTLYINPLKQKQYIDYIINLKPKRIIFNPGTENEEFMELAKANNIEALECCTLILLSVHEY